MNSITIMVPTLATIAQIGGVIIALLSVPCLGWKIRKRIRQDAVEAASAAELRREQLNALLPSPWNEAHHELTRIHDTDDSDINPKSRNFLRHWLAEQENLPRLSSEAVHKLVCLLTFEYCDKWDDCLAILAPYSDVKPLAETENLASEEAAEELLRDRLPSEWYKFWTEMKNYPSRRALFTKRIGKDAKGGERVHSALLFSLTSDQAALLSQALGNGEKDVAFYASELVKCVRAGTDMAFPRHCGRYLRMPMGPPT